MKPALVIVMAAAVIAVAFGYQFRHVYFLRIDGAQLRFLLLTQGVP